MQNTIRIFANQWFTVLPVWIYTIFGQLLIVYFTKTASNLKKIIKDNAENDPNKTSAIVQQTVVVLRSLKSLYLATAMLYRSLSFLLLANCFISVIIMFTSSYYAIEFLENRNTILVGSWDAIDVIDSFVRFWLVCHVSDRVRKTVSDFVLVLKHN